MAAYHETKRNILRKIEEAGKDGVLLSALGLYLGELDVKRDRNVKLVPWLKDYLGTELYTDEANLHVALHPLREVAADQPLKPLDRRIMDLVRANLDENGTMSLARLGNLMADNGFGKWRDNLDPGETSGKLYQWAQRHLGGEFSVKCMEDGLTWYLERRGDRVEAGGLYPEEIDCGDAASQDEVARMEAFADMGPEDFAALRDELCRMSGYEGNDPAVWKAFVARCVAYAQGHPDEMYNGTDPQTSKRYLAIRLKDLATPKGHQLYLILQENDREVPPWRVDSFGYANNIGRGKWLHTVLGIPVDNVTEERQRAALGQALSKLEALCRDAELPAALEAAAECIRKGRAFTARDEVEKLARYVSLWQEAESYNGFLGLRLTNGTGTVEQLRTALSTQDPLFARLQACGNRFADLIRVLHDQLSLSFSSGSESDRILRRDMERAGQLTGLCGGSAEDLEAARNLLYLYGGVCELSQLEYVKEDQHSNRMQSAAEYLKLSYVKMSRTVLGNEEIRTLLPLKTEVEGELLACIRELEQRAVEDAQEEQESRSCLDLEGDGRADVVREMLEPGRSDMERFKRLSAVFGLANELEEAVIDGDLERARALAEDADALHERYGYSRESAAAIRRRLLELDGLPSGMTPVYVGNRLALVQNNEHGQAERYWLMDVLRSETAIRNLLDLYRENNRSEEFMILYGRTQSGLASQSYAMKCFYAAENHDGVLQVVKRNPEIVPQLRCRGEAEVLDLIRDAANQCEDAEMKEYCVSVQAKAACPEPDGLDAAIIAQDWELLEQMLREPEAMSKQFGLSKEELEDLRAARTGEELPIGKTVQDAALRLWKLQKNRRGMAESYAWQSVRAENLPEQMEKLLFPLLEREARWSEIGVLFQAHRTVLERSYTCCRVCLRALCARSPERAAQFVREHVNVSLHEGCYARVQEICREQAPHLGTMLEQLHQAAQEPFCKAVIACDMLTLKPYSWQAERLEALGFQPEESQQIASRIRSGKYPRGEHMAALARRVFLLLGERDGLAESLTKLAFADAAAQGRAPEEELIENRAAFLGARQEWDMLAELFRECDWMREEHLGLYAETVFQTCSYEAYLADRERLAQQLPSEMSVPFETIARARVEELPDELCRRQLELPRSYVEQRAEEIIALSGWLWQSGRQSAWMHLVPQWHWAALPRYSEGQRAALLQADGMLERSRVDALLDAWTGTTEELAAAAALWREIPVPAQVDRTQSYYSRMLDLALDDETGTREETMQRLAVLFPEREEEIRIRTVFGAVEDAGANMLHPRELNWLRQNLQQGSAEDEQTVWVARRLIWLECAAKELLPDLLPKWEELLRDGVLNEEELLRLRGICENSSWQPGIDGVLALIYQRSGTPALAAAARAWEGAQQEGTPASLLELLREVPCRSEELNAFLDAVARLLPPEADAVGLAEEWEKKDGFCSREEAELLLRVCGHAQGRGYLRPVFRCLPLSDFPVLRLELLLLCAQTSGLRADWRYAIHYAVISGQERELPRLFREWLEQTQEGAEAAAILEQITGTMRLYADDMEAEGQTEDELVACEGLLQRMCQLGGLLSEVQKDGWLRTLGDFAVRYGLEMQVANSAEVMEEYYRESGLSALSRLVCRALLVGHTAAAGEILRQIAARPEVRLLPATLRLGGISYGHRYHEGFFLPMANMTQEELEELTQQKSVRIVLRCLLSDGKLPSYDDIMKKQVWPAIGRNDPEELWALARALRQMWQLVPMDYALARALFYVCKQIYALETAQGLYNGSAELIELLYEVELGICRELGRRTDGYVFGPRTQMGSSPNAQLCDLILMGCLVERRSDVRTEAWDEETRPSAALFQSIHRDICSVEAKRDKFTFQMMPFPEHGNYYTDCRQRLDELSAEARRRTECVILSRVTGVWKSEIRQLFARGEVIQECFGDWIRDPQVRFSYSHETGILRGILQVYLELDEEEQNRYRDWLGRNETRLGSGGKSRKDCFTAAAAFLRSWGETVRAEQDMLNLPLEETALDVDLMEQALRLNSSVSGEEEWRGRDYKHLEQRGLLMALLQGETRCLSILGFRSFRARENARRGVEERRDLNAAYAYSRAAHTAARYVQDRLQHENHSRYLACHVLARIKASFSVYDSTVVNAFLLCLCYGTAEDAARFLANMASEWPGKIRMDWARQRRELLYLYPVITGETEIRTEEEVRQFLEFTPDAMPLETGLLRIRMALLRQKRVDVPYLKERLAAEEAGSKGRIWEVLFPPPMNNLDERGLPPMAELSVWEEELRKNAAEEQQRAAREDAQTGAYVRNWVEEPKFVRRITEELKVQNRLEERTVDELRQEISTLQRGDDLAERRRLYCLLYHKVEREAPAQTAATRLRLGMEEWRWQQRLQNGGLANRTWLEMMGDFVHCGEENRRSSAGEAFVKLAPIALFELFSTSGTSLQELAELYFEHRDGMEVLLDCLDEQNRSCLQRICAGLDRAAEAFHNQPEGELLRTLRDVREGFRNDECSCENDGNEWSKLFSRMRVLADGTIDQMSAAPSLEIQVLNRADDPTRSIFGLLHNRGNRDAEQIVLKVRFRETGVTMLHDTYTLNRLGPGRMAAFRLRFDVPAGEAAAHYEITARCSWGEKTYYVHPLEGERAVPAANRTVNPQFVAKDIGADDFCVDENGAVYSPHMVGRRDEMRRLRDNFSGPFAQFRNTVVYGFRRVGKTTLLNYLLSHVKFTGAQQGVIPLYVSCQDAKSLQDAFIKGTLTAMLGELNGNAALRAVLAGKAEDGRWETAWSEFQQQKSWLERDRETGQDASSYEIAEFFTRLSILLERRFVLAMDEFDCLFREDIDFSTLDALVSNNVTMSRTARFAFCGSNYMIAYMMNGGALTQFFQRLEKVGVGTVPREDLFEFLQKKPNRGDALRFTEAALECIYRFTNGFIWFSGLMAKGIADQLARENRLEVYPTDVYFPGLINGIISDDNCKQFQEGCNADLLRLLADQSPHQDSCVSRQTIQEWMPDVHSADLQLLCKMGLIEADESGCYRFVNELYRCYFRSGRHTDGDEKGRLLIPEEKETDAPRGFARRRRENVGQMEI